jgi:hypothetical protein
MLSFQIVGFSAGPESDVKNTYTSRISMDLQTQDGEQAPTFSRFVIGTQESNRDMGICQYKLVTDWLRIL